MNLPTTVLTRDGETIFDDVTDWDWKDGLLSLLDDEGCVMALYAPGYWLAAYVTDDE